jgi:hypothetical protein
MNKTVCYSAATVALLVLSGCAPFRINMTLNYGAHTPPNPAPSAPATQWVDVETWQHFLVSQGYLTGSYEVNNFDVPTEVATKKFQSTPGKKGGTYSLPESACLNYATYRKAVQEGMPHYKPLRVPHSCVPCAQHTMHAKHAASGTLSFGDSFRDNTMATGCCDTGNWEDVADWQNFLINNGYLPPNFVVTGQFDAINTAPATKKFQMAWASAGLSATGKVDEKTYAFAISATFANDQGVLLVSHDGVTPTVQDQIGCSTCN